LLQERGQDPKVHDALARILRENPDETRKLRALRALHVSGGLYEALALEALGRTGASSAPGRSSLLEKRARRRPACSRR
jgi:hypothetical protein